MVPDAEFTSYYGRPVIKEPVWEVPDVPAYLFLGGLAGASSVLAAGAEFSGYGELARAAKVSALGAISLSGVALVHDLGRPGRFMNMLRVFKPTSPMSVGSWLLAGYGPVAGAAAVSEVTGLLPWAGRAATIGAGLLGPAIATYTAALICDTAVPAWHEGHREMPYVFAGSAASAAGGLGLLLARPDEARPARDLAVLGAGVELVAKRQLLQRLGAVPGQSLAEPYETGSTGKLLRAAEVLTAAGLAGAVLGGVLSGTAGTGGGAGTRGAVGTRIGGGAYGARMRGGAGTRGGARSSGGAVLRAGRGRRGGPVALGRTGRVVSALSGAALVAASAMTRWGIFQAGMASARDPKYTIVPQRARSSPNPRHVTR